MSSPEASISELSVPATATGPSLGATLLRVAWLAILLGLAIEAIVLVAAIGVTGIPGIEHIAADLTQKISWSVIVCVGLAFGQAASRGQPVWMGLAGLFAAPIAFTVVRTLHNSVSFTYKLVDTGTVVAVPVLVTVLKGMEYAALGLLLGWVGKRAYANATAYAMTGLAVGLIFGSAITYSLVGGTTTPKLIGQFINEVFFPVGCSLALFGADALAKQAK